eukprot:15315528-Ditylum_brightwellii.AAC.1
MECSAATSVAIHTVEIIFGAETVNSTSALCLLHNMTLLMKWCGRRAMCLWHKKKVVCLWHSTSGVIIPSNSCPSSGGVTCAFISTVLVVISSAGDTVGISAAILSVISSSGGSAMAGCSRHCHSSSAK